ncbi:MAG: single-stranded-DNA-specific exonuclease RecJ [Ruminococcus sp.]|nr:single-stranded-DNA-specific exonuclease RecJ [Ruminococcus sp.]
MKKWIIKPCDKQLKNAISERYGLPSVLATLLTIRGITAENDIRDFLYCEDLSLDPLSIKDMDKAVERITSAVENGEKICIYGDFDADGITSTALLYSYLCDIGADVMYYIPIREDEGYGMNTTAVEKLYHRGVRLIITVDNGIAAASEIAYAGTLGIDVVVTDHHTPPETLPEACAVVNPHRPDDKCSFKELCGVGVVFKLVQAIEGEYCDTDALLENYSDLAALGTVADLMPLVGENRALVKNGLRYINHRDRIGIAAIIENAGLSGKNITAGHISFAIGPRINAVGRLGPSKSSVELLLTEDEEYAAEIAEELTQDNIRRQTIEREILEDIDRMVKRDPSLVQKRVIVIAKEGWHKGVVGIVASRLKEIYLKPAIVISVDDDICRGSGRSVKGFALNQAVASCEEYLVQYGGHPMACGLSLKRENLDVFCEAVNAYAKDVGIPEQYLELDCKLNPAGIDAGVVRTLSQLEPYGMGNPQPLFGLYGMTLRSVTEVGAQGGHLRLNFVRDNTSISVMKFSTTPDEFPYVPGDKVDLAVKLDLNVYNDQEYVNYRLNDIKFSDWDQDDYISSEEIFINFCRGDGITRQQALSILPDRSEFATVYRFLRARGGYHHSFDTLLYRMNCDISYGKLRVILECMNELGLVRIFEGLYDAKIELLEVEGKVNLEDSYIITKLREVCA